MRERGTCSKEDLVIKLARLGIHKLLIVYSRPLSPQICFLNLIKLVKLLSDSLGCSLVIPDHPGE